MVGPPGLEPGTNTLWVYCSNQLSYRPKKRTFTLFLKIDWRIYTKNPDRPLIRDLIVEGLSLARTQKEEFKSILQNNEGDINYLFKSLEEFIIR